ncbi:MAG: hypothetical protein E6H09_04990 [Bacteroidetes bacterium]|jgi:uncharacterized protein YdaT|nr:MAG: hypothetical protein E6H09_04990 [Bacteroidota bacterium]
MPWYNGDYPPSYKNQPPRLRAKATEIANTLLNEGMPEGIAIATGLKRARQFFTPKSKRQRPATAKNTATQAMENRNILSNNKEK